jgi:hypothetical protein
VYDSLKNINKWKSIYNGTFKKWSGFTIIENVYSEVEIENLIQCNWKVTELEETEKSTFRSDDLFAIENF